MTTQQQELIASLREALSKAEAGMGGRVTVACLRLALEAEAEHYENLGLYMRATTFLETAAGIAEVEKKWVIRGLK